MKKLGMNLICFYSILVVSIFQSHLAQAQVNHLVSTVKISSNSGKGSGLYLHLTSNRNVIFTIGPSNVIGTVYGYPIDKVLARLDGGYIQEHRLFTCRFSTCLGAAAGVTMGLAGNFTQMITYLLSGGSIVLTQAEAICISGALGAGVGASLGHRVTSENTKCFTNLRQALQHLHQDINKDLDHRNKNFRVIKLSDNYLEDDGYLTSVIGEFLDSLRYN